MFHDEQKSVHFRVNPQRECSIVQSQQRLCTINMTAKKTQNENEMSFITLAAHTSHSTQEARIACRSKAKKFIEGSQSKADETGWW